MRTSTAFYNHLRRSIVLASILLMMGTLQFSPKSIALASTVNFSGRVLLNGGPDQDFFSGMIISSSDTGFGAQVPVNPLTGDFSVNVPSGEEYELRINFFSAPNFGPARGIERMSPKFSIHSDMYKVFDINTLENASNVTIRVLDSCGSPLPDAGIRVEVVDYLHLDTTSTALVQYLAFLGSTDGQGKVVLPMQIDNEGGIIRAFYQGPLGSAGKDVLLDLINLSSGEYTLVMPTPLSLCDTIPPSVTGSPDRAANAAGWYNAPVTISWSAIDSSPSSGTPSTPQSTLASLEGTNTYTSAQSCDPAGNCATGLHTLSIDTGLPSGAFTGSTLVIRLLLNQQITGTAGDGLSGVAKVEVVNGATVLSSNPGGAISLNCNTQKTSCTWTANPAALPGGSQMLTLRVTDVAGNVVTTTKSYILL